MKSYFGRNDDFINLFLDLLTFKSPLDLCIHICTYLPFFVRQSTGKSLSEALIFASVNPQHDARLFMELQVQYMTIPCAEHLENMLLT